MTFAKTNVFSYATDGSSSNVTTGVTITDMEDNFGRTVEVDNAQEDPFINDIEQTGGMQLFKMNCVSCRLEVHVAYIICGTFSNGCSKCEATKESSYFNCNE